MNFFWIATPISSVRNDEMSLRIFAFANKKIVADLLANFMDKRRNMGVLCGVLNLDTQGKKEVETIYVNEFTPYFALAALAVQ